MYTHLRIGLRRYFTNLMRMIQCTFLTTILSITAHLQLVPDRTWTLRPAPCAHEPMVYTQLLDVCLLSSWSVSSHPIRTHRRRKASTCPSLHPPHHELLSCLSPNEAQVLESRQSSTTSTYKLNPRIRIHSVSATLLNNQPTFRSRTTKLGGIVVFR